MRIYDFEGKKNISGERIREARLKLRLSQSDLAAEVKRVETWLNDYPREILGFMSSAEAFKIAFDRAA